MGSLFIINDIIYQLKINYNMDISIFDLSFFKRSINIRISDMKLKNIKEYEELIIKNTQEIILLKKLLNNTYTRFFRDSFIFAQLDKIVIPNLITMIDRQREIRIWSAGSSSGQEAYSIAILISELEEELRVKIPYRIIATDISEIELEKGRNGIFKKMTSLI